MKRLLIIVTGISIFSFLFVSCYYDNEEALYPSLSTSCDTTNVTFNGTIVPVLMDNCYSCHSNKTAVANGNNIAFEFYADVKNYSEHILASVKHTPGHSFMPKNGGQIKDCSIIQIEIWVKNGMPDN